MNTLSFAIKPKTKVLGQKEKALKKDKFESDNPLNRPKKIR